MNSAMNNAAAMPKVSASKIWKSASVHRDWEVLVVTDRPETRRSLLRMFDGLPITAFTAATIEQANEVLFSHSVAVIFCDEMLSDGSYRQLLASATACNHKMKRFVVTLGTGEWDEHQEAMRLGATDVLKSPLQSIDVELVLIRAGRDRDKDRQGFDVIV